MTAVDGPIAELVTLICVTSPVRSNPSTEMLEWTLQSFVAGGQLGQCKKILVSDGFTAATDGQKARPKSGRVLPESVAPYAEFRDRLDALLATCDARKGIGDKTELDFTSHTLHLRMERRSGFGGCVKEALALVTTPYVLVLQHDRPCLRSIDAKGILAAMICSGGNIKYIGLPTRASLSRSTAVNAMVRCRVRLSQDEVDGEAANWAAAAGIRLRFLFFWYDSAHFGETEHYKTFVFNTGRVPRGGYPEDTLGQMMHSEICEAAASSKWREVHANYGSYLYVDDGEEAVGHLKGRKYIESSELKKRGWQGLRHTLGHVDNMADVAIERHLDFAQDPMVQANSNIDDDTSGCIK